MILFMCIAGSSCGRDARVRVARVRRRAVVRAAAGAGPGDPRLTRPAAEGERHCRQVLFIVCVKR